MFLAWFLVRGYILSMWILYGRCVLQDGQLQATKFCSRWAWNPKLFLDSFFLQWSRGSTFYHYPQSGVISEIKNRSYRRLDNCTVKDSCGWISNTEALSHCLFLSFLLQPGLKPTRWSTTEHHGPPNTPGGPCTGRKQRKLFLEMEMVSMWSAQKSFGSCPGLNSWTTLLPTALQTSWDFLVRILVNVGLKMMFFDVSDTFWHFSLKIPICSFF